MSRIYYFLFVILFISCDNNEARRPINSNSSNTNFYASVIKQNKILNNREKQFLEKLIAKDSVNKYIQSENGLWYYYNKKNSSDNVKKPKSGDMITIKYSISDIYDVILYEEQIKNYKVDKQELIIGLQDGIKLMKQGEIVTFVIPSYRAYGVVGDDYKIGINQPIKAKVNLINIK